MRRNLTSKTMKRIFLFLALALLAVSVSAQGRYNYDSSHKYGFFSNWTLGVSGQYSNQHGASNVGITALATKRVGDYWRLRYEASINGLRCVDGFDRYGTAMAGASFDFLNWMYLFADAGAVVNPTMASKLGLAADAGLGLNVNFGKHSMLWLEGGSDLVQNNAAFDNTFFVRLGYGVRPGITERDRVDIDIKHHNAERLGNLTEENKLLKSDLKRQQEANDTLMATLNKASALFAAMEKRLDECNERVKEAESKAVDRSMFKFHFDYASIVLSETQEGRVAILAHYINTVQGRWRVDGYASPDGADYNNMVISQQRAETVCKILEANGVSHDRLVPIGNGVTWEYGEDSPLNRMVVVTQIAP